SSKFVTFLSHTLSDLPFNYHRLAGYRPPGNERQEKSGPSPAQEQRVFQGMNSDLPLTRMQNCQSHNLVPLIPNDHIVIRQLAVGGDGWLAKVHVDHVRSLVVP